jgi:stringent starvation protein B
MNKPGKLEVAKALLERSRVFVYLDPRRVGSGVPETFRKDPKLVLQVGPDMSIPTLDLDFGDDAITCTLKFSQKPFRCVIPWHAVFALTDDSGQGIVWDEDVPAEIVEAQSQARAPKRQPAPKSIWDK